MTLQGSRKLTYRCQTPSFGSFYEILNKLQNKCQTKDYQVFIRLYSSANGNVEMVKLWRIYFKSLIIAQAKENNFKNCHFILTFWFMTNKNYHIKTSYDRRSLLVILFITKQSISIIKWRVKGWLQIPNSVFIENENFA